VVRGDDGRRRGEDGAAPVPVRRDLREDRVLGHRRQRAERRAAGERAREAAEEAARPARVADLGGSDSRLDVRARIKKKHAGRATAKSPKRSTTTRSTRAAPRRWCARARRRTSATPADGERAVAHAKATSASAKRSQAPAGTAANAARAAAIFPQRPPPAARRAYATPWNAANAAWFASVVAASASQPPDRGAA